jgi:RNA polymerase sigma-70 factor (ECF subfamily)
LLTFLEMLLPGRHRLLPYPRYNGASRAVENSVPSDAQRSLVQRLFIEHVDELKGFVTSLVPGPELAEDVIQETFVAVTARADGYDPGKSFTEWLFVVARDKLRELGGKASAEARPFADEVLDVLTASHKGVSLSPEHMQFVDECIERLAPQARRIIALRYQSSMKPRQVAKAIGWTAASVRVALSRARTAIRECVERKVSAALGDS